MEWKAKELAERIGGELAGDPEQVLKDILPLQAAGPDHVTFITSLKQVPQLENAQAGAVICPLESEIPGKTLIKIDNPKLGFARAMQAFHPRARVGDELHPGAIVSSTAQIGADCHIGAGVVIGKDVVLGDRVDVLPNVVLGDRVRVGSDCLIHALVSIGADCVLEDRVILHSGVVVGSDGYGYATDMRTGVHEKIPQAGNVVIESDVEVGSNTSIDRAVFGTTRIGQGTKIDNLVQIAHNVEIGAGCLIVSQVGIAGSTTLGAHVIVAGQAGIKDHIKVGDGAVIGGGSAVTRDVPAGATIYGQPARSAGEENRLLILRSKLPKLFAVVKELQKRLSD